MTPNPSLEPTRIGMALGPLPGVGHHPSSGPSTTPPLAPQLKRQASLTLLSTLPPLVVDIAVSSTKWLNENQGLVSVAIFLATLFLGWASGIFSALRRKPKFKIELIPGPTFVCVFSTGEQFNDHDVHRVGIALYLSIANCGSAASSLHELHVGYRWNLIPFTRSWLRHTLLRHWLRERTAALADFQVAIGENLKIYPFLFQANSLSFVRQETYLQPGQSVVGVVYYEQADSWGGCQPLVWHGRVRLAVRVIDVYGGKHTRTLSVPAVTLDEARKFNPAFGQTLAELQGKPLPGEDA